MALRSKPSKDDNPKTGMEQVLKNIGDLRKRIPLLGNSVP
jgi:hypothetical protein